MTPYALTTDQRSEPLGVGDTRPRLSRKLGSDRRGAARTAYRITVTVPPGSTAVLDIPTCDPGRVRENDRPVPAVPSAAGATVRLTSGRFTFTATSY